ncbi:unnamed protein product [Strongylus vulgaris]|uniref:Regulator of chromosome condensation n=1 Tax=Strongylus vulgaris TaxID=40348 RepID=A0A3P7KLR7_STRVU|nr:unnamed protein product [Strongylus vulgaris]
MMARKSTRLSEKENSSCMKQCNQAKTATTTGRRGRKRKVVEDEVTPTKALKTPRRGRTAHAKVKLSYSDFVSLEIGDRVLSCGEGEQLGHPGRTTTKKPRKVDIIEDEGLQIVQVVAGGVHSALLTADGDVYMCGINEQGTVPAIGLVLNSGNSEL